MAKSLAWAQSWHGEMATVRAHNGQLIPGIGIAYVGPGGWGNVRVFTPKHIYLDEPGRIPYRITQEEPYRFPLPFRNVSWGNHGDIAALDYWEDIPELADLKRFTLTEDAPCLLQGSIQAA